MEQLITHLAITAPVFGDAWTSGLGQVKTIYTEVAPYLTGAVWFATGISTWMSHHLVKQHLATAGLASIILMGADAIANTLH